MRRAFKLVAKTIGVLIALIMVAVVTVFVITEYSLRKNYEMSVGTVPIPKDAESIARGKHLAEAVGKCQNCHGANYTGRIVSDAPIFMDLTSSNLTSGKGGIGAAYNDEDWVRAIRFGIGRTGKSLVMMPSEAFNHFNDADLGAIIAHVKSLPPADIPVTPKRSIGPIARAVWLAGGELPLVPAAMIPQKISRAAPVRPAVSKAYGEYLAKAGACTGCHSASLSGGNKIEGVIAPNLTPGGELAKWTEADFMKLVRTGTRPDGRIISAVMPWPYMKGLTDDEIRAMWMYIHTVPAKKQGEKDAAS